MKVNKETKHFSKKQKKQKKNKLKLENKMEHYTDQSACVTLKDNKENFQTKLPCGLINPVKSETRLVSKVEP